VVRQGGGDVVREVLIVGAGIGGLSAAIALGQSSDHEVTVIEIQADLHSSTYGVGIIQPVNALRALDAIGCAQQCLAEGYATKAWGRMLNQAGEPIREMPGATIPGLDLPPMNGITRRKLHRILTERALAVGVRIDYGTTILGLEQSEYDVEASFQDGRRRSFDLVVGADGVRSTVRRYVLGELAPRYIGQSCFRMNLPRLEEIDRIVLQHGETGMAGYVPIGPELAYLFMNVVWDRSQRPSEDELPGLLKQQLAPFGGLTAHVRDTYVDGAEEIVLRPEEGLIAPPPWHQGRIVLLGDAVHTVTPHMGQGAAQAIEDGVVLADSVRGASSLEQALTRYTERRYERCKLVVEASWQIGEWEINRTQGVDQAGLTQRVIEAMVQPI
jgi:2-polyprenyl-6-methoxyphenol hydroxylase-like FAD-dependent oxidoreductase